MKLIALDLDGTTLTSNNNMSQENIDAIKKAQKNGHIVMILSGRPPESIHEVLNTYHLNCPIGASNGTVLYANGQLLDSISLDSLQIKKVTKQLDQYFIPYKAYTNKGIYSPIDWMKRFHSIPKEYIPNERYEIIIQQPKHINDQVHSLFDDDISVQKFFILVFDPVKKKQLLNALSEIENIGITSSSSFNLEVMNIHGNKGYGLTKMANHFHIPLSDTIAIGDNYNDVSMFETAGLSIAMGNAENEIKKICHKVTLTNDEDGVAYAINQFILNS
jgi:Cof subfamily protein (haloacid dehalogenase superfamily)